MTTLARACVWHADGGFTLEEVPVPEAGRGEAVVAVTHAGICGSDEHTVAGRRPAPSPSVLGHESVGVVVAVGPGCRDVAGAAVLPGDRVVWTVTVSCGQCDRCSAGLTAKCRQVRKVGHESFAGPWPLSGGYASHILLPAGTGIVRVPDRLDEGPAAMSACAVATAVACVEHASQLHGGRLEGLHALVVGAGALGTAACAALAEAGCEEVLVAEPVPERARQARSFGATGAFDGTRPVDVAIDFSGHAEAIQRALDALDLAGVMVLAGSVTPGPTVALDPEAVVRGYRRIGGVHNYEPRHLVAAVDLLQRTNERMPWLALTESCGGLGQLPTLLGSAPSSPTILRRSVTPAG